MLKRINLEFVKVDSPGPSSPRVPLVWNGAQVILRGTTLWEIWEWSQSWSILQPWGLLRGVLSPALDLLQGILQEEVLHFYQVPGDSQDKANWQHWASDLGKAHLCREYFVQDVQATGDVFLRHTCPAHKWEEPIREGTLSSLKF